MAKLDHPNVHKTAFLDHLADSGEATKVAFCGPDLATISEFSSGFLEELQVCVISGFRIRCCF